MVSYGEKRKSPLFYPLLIFSRRASSIIRTMQSSLSRRGFLKISALAAGSRGRYPGLIGNIGHDGQFNPLRFEKTGLAVRPDHSIAVSVVPIGRPYPPGAALQSPVCMTFTGIKSD